MKKTLKKAASLFVSSAMLMSSFAAMQIPSASAAGNCTIDPETEYQTIRGFGGINHREWTGYDLSDAEVQRAFGNGANELGMSILRIFVNDNSSQWNLAIPVAKKAQALGATVFATPWNPPASMRSNGNGQPRGGKYVLNNGAEAQYAKHLNDFVKYCEGQGVNLFSISVQNEPDWSGEWTYWSPDRAANFLANYGKAVTEGTNCKMMSPESFSYSKDYYNAILNNSKAMANCDIFGTHFYGTQRSAMDFPALENCGKDIWMTEVYVPDSKISCEAYPESLDQSVNIHDGLVVGNMNAYVVWYIKRSYGPLNESGNISKRGYCMAQYSKWVRPGDVRIDATESPESNVLVSAYKDADNVIKVVAINKDRSSSKTENFTISGVDNISGIEAYRTSANENIAPINVDYSGGSFSSTLPASSVTTFVVSAGEVQPDPNGYLFHATFENGTEGFTGRGGESVAAASAEKYEGSSALAVTDRDATWHGATHTLNTSKFKPGESYSFSAIVKQNSNTAEKMHLSIEYKLGSDSETQYAKIDTQAVPKGEWTQLSNVNYTIPAGATNVSVYVETDGETGTKTDFYVDEFIIAPAGTVIDGPHPDVVLPPEYKLGDLNGDGKITAVDLTIAKKGMKSGFADNNQKKFADVDQSGTVDADDIAWYVKYLTAQETAFPTPVTPPAAEMRTITEYTNAVKNSLVMTESQDSKQKKAGVTYPQITKEYYFSKKANKNKPYNIMLPANYDSSKKYPVLYLLHGFFEDEDRMILTGNETPIPTPQIITNAIAEGEAKEMIVVVPLVFTHPTLNGAVSFQDYESSVGYDNFVDDIVDSLMPHIEGKYSVATGRENTAVTGFSMGGRESLRIGMKYPDKFGYIGAICPAPGVEGPWSWKEEEAPSLVLLTGGTNDEVVGLNTPQGYHDNFDKAGTPHLWHVVQGGYHGDNCIRAHVYNFVRFIFKA